MPITPSQFQEMALRVEKNRGRKNERVVLSEVRNEVREIDLHDRIVAYCNNQWPRWKYVHARTDKKSTIGLGVCDFVIFMPKGQTLCIECKSKDGKLSGEQMCWSREMEILGHIVHVVRGMDEFMKLVGPIENPTPNDRCGAGTGNRTD